MVVDAPEGYRLWSQEYDAAPNPLLALEMRVVKERLNPAGHTLLDAGSGTGRWMAWAAERGALVFGVDACREMILQAEKKPGLAGRSVLADLRAIPVRGGVFDIAICSFTLGYIAEALAPLRELARVARRVIVSDLHPAAVRSGWTRSFRAGDRYEIRHYDHAIEELDHAAGEAGLTLDWRTEASFGEPERETFRRAGRESAFEQTRHTPAVLITAWRKS